MRVRIPPLRERREDIPLLVQHYYKIFTDDEDAVAPEALIAPLQQQSWPGNVRELRSAVERAVLMVDPMPSAPPGTVFDDRLSFREAKERAIGAWEGEYLGELVARHAGNLTRAARAARMDRAHLRELLRKYGKKPLE